MGAPNSLWTQITTFTSTRIGTSVGMVGKTPKMGWLAKNLLGQILASASHHFPNICLPSLEEIRVLKPAPCEPQLATSFQQDKSANKSCYSSQGLALKKRQDLADVGRVFFHCSPFLVYSLRGSCERYFFFG